jgi:hypothetical protein
MTNHRTILVTIASLGLCMATVLPAQAVSSASVADIAAEQVQAAATITADAQAALAGMRKKIADSAANDPSAAADLANFDALTAAQRSELAGYLLGDASLVTPPATASRSAVAGTNVAIKGDARWISSTGTSKAITPRLGQRSAMTAMSAATYSVHSYADEVFNFAGITISKTRVWADCTTGSDVVLGISDYGCQMVQNYDLFSSITTSKQSGILSGGKATFKCYVVIERGAPTPLGQITWRTASAYQYMTVTGTGISAHGFM